MRNIFFLGLVVGLILSLTSPAHAANLLANPGFETWGPWGPGGAEVPATWWHMFNTTSTVNGVKESTIKQGGLFSGKTYFPGGTAGAWGGWGQRVAFTAGNTLYAHQPINIPSLGGNNSLATLEIGFESAPDVPIGAAIKTSRSTTTSGWDALDYTGVAPAGTTSIKYVVLLETWGNGTGSVYFDDAYASNAPIPEPASMLLLGSGLIGLFGISRKKS